MTFSIDFVSFVAGAAFAIILLLSAKGFSDLL